jgi:hypothetical protein
VPLGRDGVQRQRITDVLARAIGALNQENKITGKQEGRNQGTAGGGPAI